MNNLAKCYLYRLYAFMGYALPMLILFGVNHEAYISTGAAVGFFGILILALCLISFKNTVLSFVKAHFLLSFSVVLLAVSAAMKALAGELLLISFVSLLGSILQGVFDTVADVYHNHAYITREDGTRAKNGAPALPDRTAWKEAYGLGGE